MNNCSTVESWCIEYCAPVQRALSETICRTGVVVQIPAGADPICVYQAVICEAGAVVDNVTVWNNCGLEVCDTEPCTSNEECCEIYFSNPYRPVNNPDRDRHPGRSGRSHVDRSNRFREPADPDRINLYREGVVHKDFYWMPGQSGRKLHYRFYWDDELEMGFAVEITEGDEAGGELPRKPVGSAGKVGGYVVDWDGEGDERFFNILVAN